MLMTMPDELDNAINEAMEQPRIPRATYRLQLNADFTFTDARDLIGYLHDLGISDVYTSPLFRPRSGSTHGYDVVHHNEFNPVLGSEADFNSLTDTLEHFEMGLLLDIVPNHMGVNTENDWWMDVLKHGPSSVYADYFDIDWRPRNRALDNRVLIPTLGDHYGRVLEAGELELVYWHGDFYVHYYDHQFPLTPETYRTILEEVHRDYIMLDEQNESTEMELSSLIVSLSHLPHYTATEENELTVRRREQVIIRRRLLALFESDPSFRTAIDMALTRVNGIPGEPSSFDLFDGILRRQPYRLSYWRVAADEINYRRFFDINDMAAIRIENPHVFEDVHRLTIDLLARKAISGLRIDHPDGLWDPEAYFFRLQEMYVTEVARRHTEDNDLPQAAVSARMRLLETTPNAQYPLYVLVEKILSETEPLPESWAVYGTTGYRFLNLVNGLFVRRANEDTFNDLYTAFTGMDTPFDELTDYTKKLVMSQSLNSEIEARAAQLSRIVEQNRRYQGFSRASLAAAMSEIIAALPIYRTYITGPGKVNERDRNYINEAVATAREHSPLMPASVFEFLRETLLMENLQDFNEQQRADLREFVMQFQQITGPVMAKSIEDTAFYIYNRLTSLNEVGGHPEHFGTPIAEFHTHHAINAFPYTMLSTSTHDTKRSEDVRARLNVLSEMPDLWAEAVNRWSAINNIARGEVDGEQAPSRNDEYLLYQSLLGIYLADASEEDLRDRLVRYMHKAVNEAKTRSNWVNPNRAYADALTEFIYAMLENDAFMADFRAFAEPVMQFGYYNSLSQTLLKLTCPGVPDIYQGTELWDFSLVDPDNRRPVNYEHRRNLLNEIRERENDARAALAADLIDRLPDGAAKLYIVYRTLQHRRENEAFFREASYTALTVDGPHAEHVCAFMRHMDDQLLMIVVPRWGYTLASSNIDRLWGDDTLWDGTQVSDLDDVSEVENLFTEESLSVEDHTLSVAALLKTFPVGLFVVR